jgi:hypothetical protein
VHHIENFLALAFDLHAHSLTNIGEFIGYFLESFLHLAHVYDHHHVEILLYDGLRDIQDVDTVLCQIGTYLGDDTNGILAHYCNNRAHIVRAAQEGIVFSFCYGMEIMQQMGMDIKNIHAGKANMFLSPLFRDTLAGVSGATIELYETDGSAGAAKGAGIGAGIYKDHNEAFASLKKLAVIDPDEANRSAYLEAYSAWKEEMKKL